jgi:hypothetical protein
LAGNELGAEGTLALQTALLTSVSLAAVNLLRNQVGIESAATLLRAKEERPSLRTLCGLSHEEVELDFKYNGLGAGDAMLLAPEIAGMASLTTLDAQLEHIGEEGKAALMAAVKGREGFRLKL